MVNITRVYTRTGDKGTTRLTNNAEVSKTDPRVHAYGQVDELNSAVGYLLAAHTLPEEMRAALALIQNELFDVGADISNPVYPNPAEEQLRILPESITRLEHWCDEFGADVPKLRSFILPTGSPAAAWLHLCRTLARRAERYAWEAVNEYGLAEDEASADGGLNPHAIRYLNRLSDLFFVMSRKVSSIDGVGETLWVPGGERNATHHRHR